MGQAEKVRLVNNVEEFRFFSWGQQEASEAPEAEERNI